MLNPSPVPSSLVVKNGSNMLLIRSGGIPCPLSFISMLGGTLTLIGTSTNVLASSLLSQYDMRPFGMFEFTQIGVIVLIIGVVYFLTIGRFLLPSRETEATEEDFIPSHFLATVRVDHGSRFIGKSVKQLDFETKFNLDEYGISLIKDKKRIVVDTLKWNGKAKKSGFETGDFISELKVENLDRPNKRIIYPLAILLLIIFGYLNYRRKN